MYQYVAMFAGILFLASFSYAAPIDPSKISCLEADRGYQLIKQDGSIDVVRFYSHAVKKFGDSSLNGQTQSGLQQFGVTTGDPREWARLFVMVCKQESGCRIARTYADGSLERFPSTLAKEKSFGPLQFNKGEYGLTTWAMVNSPSCSLEAFIRVAERKLLFRYFGSMQRPHETLRHANWFNQTVQPFTDALTLTFDPNAPDMSRYQALSPYFVSPEQAMLMGGNPNYGNYGMLHPNMSQMLGGQYSYNPTTGLLSGAGTSQFSIGSGMTGSVSQPAYGSQPGSTQPPNGNGTTPVTQTAPQSHATLLVQPSTVAAGRTVQISWTSVGMRRPPYCEIVIDDSQNAYDSGKEGTAMWIAESGSHTVELLCEKLDGSIFELSRSISVQ